MPKNKKEHRLSERRKYLKTLMADMGLVDIESLPKEEAAKWRRAAEPQKIVQKRLREMGYSLDSNKNKRSLGRISKFIQIKRATEINPDIKKLQDILGLDAYRKVVPTVLPIFSMTGIFSKKKYLEEALEAIREVDSGAADNPEVVKALEGLSSSLFKGTVLKKDLGKIFYEDPSVILGPEEISQKHKKTLVVLLSAKGLLELSPSPSDEQIFSALKEFQKSRGLQVTGKIDKDTYSELIIDLPSKPSEKGMEDADTEGLSEIGSNINSNTLYSALFSYLKNRNLCIAMVANAIHESNLQPGIAGDCGSYGERKRNRSINIESKGLCCSYGLWQYNICTRTSMGTKYLKHYGLQNGTDQEKLEILTDAKKQIEYMIYYLKANYSGEISSEKSVEEWTEWFVVNVENPADHGGAISSRIPTAQDLARTIPEDNDAGLPKELDLSGIKNIRIGGRADLRASSDDVKYFLSVLDNIAGDMGVSFTVTSAFRTDYDQARIMYNNYSSRGVGSYRARNYLEGLYKSFPNVDLIVGHFESDISDDQKLAEVERIISETWPAVGHRAGKAVDLSGLSRSEFDRLLNESEKYVYLKTKLWEGDHYHIAVDSVREKPAILA